MEFLIVGSMTYPTYSTLVVTTLDDAGNILQSREYPSNTYTYLTGIKGIHANNEFVIIGVDSDGFQDTDSKEILVMGIDENTLNINWQHELSSANTTYDFDMVTDIISIPSGNVFITGTSNTINTSSTVSSEAVMCALINSSGIVWTNSYTTQTNSWDAGACALYNPNTASIYVLGNNALNQAFHITEFDTTSGTQLNAVYVYDTTGQYDKFGFEMRFTDISSDIIMVSGYEFQYGSSGGTNGDTYAFLCEIEHTLTTVNQTYSYAAINSWSPSSGIYNYIENSMLYLTPHEFPYYYNNMMSERYDDAEYVMVGNSNANVPSTYGKKIWSISDDLWSTNGYTSVCDTIPTHYELHPGIRAYTTSIIITGNDVDDDNLDLQSENIDITTCAPFLKKENTTSMEEQVVMNDAAYPNPITHTLQIKPAKELPILIFMISLEKHY